MFSIASSFGVLISTDQATMQHTYSHFAWILIKINLVEEITDQIFLEREGFAFFIALEYEFIFRRPVATEVATGIDETLKK
uniref:Uncharacterized protein n=1 Tax=Cajanus cajan TaxID=3821 RepID=A0A151U3B2_CAJCA|nr:hypothetical protein KK1_006476 [Cajanus cajan]